MNLIHFEWKFFLIDFNTKKDNYACIMQNDDGAFFHYRKQFV